MTFTISVIVIDITQDFDPQGNEYAKVVLGQKLPMPIPPDMPKVYPPPPKPIAYKHYMHVMIPKEKWTGQFTMWKEYDLIVNDDGSTELKKVEV